MHPRPRVPFTRSSKFTEPMMLKPSEPASADYSRRPFPTLPPTHEPRLAMQTNSSEKERWARVKQRLRAEVGEDIFSSWFARMDLDAVEEDIVRLSVPTRFLKSWIQAHYFERVLACWRAEEPTLRRIDLAVRSAVIRTHARLKPEPAREPERATQNRAGERSDARAVSAPAPA